VKWNWTKLHGRARLNAPHQGILQEVSNRSWRFDVRNYQFLRISRLESAATSRLRNVLDDRTSVAEGGKRTELNLRGAH
jgi:hypothetical protein